MTAPRPPRPLPHSWVLYVAGLAPALAIAFAFALGPSPRKKVAELFAAPPESAEELLQAMDEEARALVVEALPVAETPHRELIVRHLGEMGDRASAPTLSRLSEDPSTPERLRLEARRALERIARGRQAPNEARATARPVPPGSDRS